MSEDKVREELARVLADCGISVGSMFQEPHGATQADIIFLSHESREGAIDERARHDRPGFRIDEPGHAHPSREAEDDDHEQRADADDTPQAWPRGTHAKPS